MKLPKTLKVPQHVAAARLGISSASVSAMMGKNALKKADHRNVTAGSLFIELGKRMSLFGKALDAKEGECRCGCGKTVTKQGNDFLVGHDRVLRSTLQTIFNTGRPLEKEIIKWFIKYNEMDFELEEKEEPSEFSISD